jgi:hypothetical protein
MSAATLAGIDGPVGLAAAVDSPASTLALASPAASNCSSCRSTSVM